MALPSRVKPFRIRLIPLLLLVLAVFPYVWDIGRPPDPFARRAPGAEEATPDSRTAQISAAPAQERSRHLAGLGVESWHQAGWRGRGVTVAILDSGFRGYRKQLGKALPDRVAVRSFRVDQDLEARDSQHGILCAEVVHALAPEAGVILANWEPDHPSSFVEAVGWARRQGAQIISCSLIMPSWSDGEGGGSVHAALARLLGTGRQPHDLLFFACAGNTAQRHWAGRFHPDAHGFHEWLPGQTSNTLRPWGKDRVAVEVYGPVDGDYDLQVLEHESDRLVGHASIHWGFDEAALRGTKKQGGCAVVRFLPEPERRYAIRLFRPDRPDAKVSDKFHVVVLGGSLERATMTGSIPFPADGDGVEAVGAVDGEGRRLFYSSCGPNSRRPKPDFVAPVPFASLLRERAFAGTSAAAPQAAGHAALWRSRHPDWSADRVRLAMRESARDLGPKGHDWETGYGLVHLPEIDN
jgi:subtilisin family serine protease